MPRQSQRKLEAAAASTKKPTSIIAPDPDDIPPQIRSNEKKEGSAGPNTETGLKLIGPAPYDDDDVAVAERNSIDYSVKVKNKFTFFIQKNSYFFLT